MGEVADGGTAKIADSDARGLGARGRLAVTAEYAHELDRVADVLETDVREYEDVATLFFDGIDLLIESLEADPEQLTEGGDALEFAMSIRTLASTTRVAMASQGGLVATLRENAKISRVLRDPTNRIGSALERFAATTPRLDEWDRRLQALGVPLPPESDDEAFGSDPADATSEG
jgi:hypothetical protein